MRARTGKAKRVTEINTLMIEALERERERERERGGEGGGGGGREREMERKGVREREINLVARSEGSIL